MAEEAQRYGDAGAHPQVVWANGVLASSAVGLGVDLLTGWTGNRGTVEYLSYDEQYRDFHAARQALVQEGVCPHHSQEGTGDPF